MYIEVTGTVEERTIQGKRGAFKVREQPAYAHIAGEKYPSRTKIGVPDDLKDGYAIGKYEIEWDRSVYIGEFDRLTIANKIVLGKKVG